VFFKWGWKISVSTHVMWSTFREPAVSNEEATKMSDQEREKLVKQIEDGDETGEDVDAHIKKGRDANDEGGDSGDDVEAHIKKGRDANDEGDDSEDDVEAHVKQR